MSAGAFRVARLAGCAVMEMPAEIDVTNSGQARQALLAALDQRPAVLVVDMSQTTFCDSTGIAALVDAHRQASTNGAQLMLVAPEIERILQLTGFGKIVAMHPSLDAACAAAGPGRQD